ncbi:hypothetical protein GGR52DRAFT_548512 [Hypoxylon sp. FL1284]|nr:hypothetical protein GGR52DRAFT_548512 [Hypoxylon sp. FL1284]
MSRSLLRSVLELRTPITRLPPTFLLPIRARGLATTTTPTESISSSSPTMPPSATPSQTTVPPIAPTASKPSEKKAAAEKPKTTSASVAELFPLLRAQPGGHYATVHVHGRPYLVTQGDRVRLPFRMPGVVPGDVLRLDRVSTLGSRDYTLLGTAPSASSASNGHEFGFVDPALFECRATVLGHESEPLRVMVKTKRRNRRAQRVKSKHRYTILRISELKLLGPP